MRSSSAVSLVLGALASLAGSANAQSWKTIPTIQAVGQHFFYSNNGSQYYLKGVAYQQNYQPNGQVSANTQYTDPLADGSICARDIPFMEQLFTNVIRVYAIDPTVNHDDCMEQLANKGIYVFADLSEPSTSIQSNNPQWNVPLYARYTAVVDALAKYNNVIGFFAGNEVVQAANQTASAAFVKAAVRDTKAYIKSMKYRSSLGVGYATADVPTRDDLAAYFACTPGSDGSLTSIDFWGYNVYSWCGQSNYAASSYGERVEFFRDYPVPVFFAEYGCNEGLPGGPYSRPFTEVPVLYGNMTDVFSGGIVYQYFDSENQFGLVKVNGNSVSPYPDFTSLRNQLAKVSPTITQSSAYKPSNTAPACPTDSTWAAVATPLPPTVNPQFCACEAAALQCGIASDDGSDYGAVFNYICGSNESLCEGIARNATTGDYGALSGCSAKQQLAWVANQYYLAQNSNPSACAFNGVASVQSPSTAAGCSALIASAGTAGTGAVPAPTGQQGTAVQGGGAGGATGVASSSSSGVAARIGGGMGPAGGAGGGLGFFDVGKALFAGYLVLAVVSGAGILLL
ncbi:Glucanosyltransferase-domain-containing protein [Microdochium trichocladiopsis]|uniref:1,3-beta-glucanosyltransferase n=1 Tax=Microdochium trichocladiopsis TaxID=1682393 RepID=A0A9P9BKS0_9PEZI|nr:Glucanosyltransferase-domain-containing protein [Microdochium trichocladiopsis]KAH7020892.1 Glucanosyltransferase-domain-containing protein [Microdochium trichocladiopsis]